MKSEHPNVRASAWMKHTVRVGLIGCGSIAQLVHLDLLRRSSDMELVALAEIDPARREAAQRKAPQAAAVVDHRELLGLPNVDAVVVCLPTPLHAAVALAALEHRKHVYLEKPLATNLVDARAVWSAWQRAGTIAMIGFNLRFHPLYEAARQEVRSGRLGTLVAARSVLSTAARALPAWKQSRSSGGGVLLDLASHHIDLLAFLFEQEVREVFAVLRSQRTEDDTALLELRLANDVLVQSFFSLGTVDEDRFDIYGNRGKLAIDRRHGLHVESTDGTTARRTRASGLWQRLLAPRRDPSYAAALRHFVRAVLTGQPATPGCSDGYRSLAVVTAAEESARTGRPVPVEQPSDESVAG